MKFPFLRFLELRNEFYGIDLPHVGYFLCIIGQKPVQLSHWHCIIFLFLSSPAFVATFEMDNILGSVDGNNTGDGQTLSCVPQESPSEISGPTVDVSMRSGKKTAPKKLKKLCHLQKSLITLRLLTWCQNACDRYHSEHT